MSFRNWDSNLLPGQLLFISVMTTDWNLHFPSSCLKWVTAYDVHRWVFMILTYSMYSLNSNSKYSPSLPYPLFFSEYTFWKFLSGMILTTSLEIADLTTFFIMVHLCYTNSNVESDSYFQISTAFLSYLLLYLITCDTNLHSVKCSCYIGKK